MATQNGYEEKHIEKSFDLDIFRRLFTFTRPYLFLLLVSLILLLAVTGVDLFKPYLTKIVIDDYIKGIEKPLTIDPDGPITLNGRSFSFGDAGTTGDASILKSGETYYLVERSLTSSQRSQVRSVDGKPHLEGIPLPVKTLTEGEVEAVKSPLRDGITRLVLVFGVILILGFVLNFVQIYLLNKVSQRIVYDMRMKLFDHIQSLPLRFFDKNPVGRLTTRVGNDMNNIAEMYTGVLINAFKDFFLLFGTVVIMLSIDVTFTLISLSTMPLVLLASYVFRLKAREAQRAVKVKLAVINAKLSENISGMRIIQFFNREKAVYDAFDRINEDHRQASRREIKIYAIFRPSMNLIYSLTLAIILYYGGQRVLGATIELGVLVAFISYTEQFFRPIFDLTEKFNILQSAMASSERIFLLLDETSDLPEPEEPKLLDPLRGDLSFQGVTFRYEEEDVLKDVSFDVKAGETIAIVGHTGAGKSTIINLINRFYDVNDGAITIDNTDIRDVPLKHLREQIGIVLQDVFIFSGDIKSNIRLHSPGISDEKIREVAHHVNADHFIKRLPQGYDEVMAERGATLSSGERQLLSFARALAHDPKILILDEATANIDTETEHLIQDAIKKLIEGRTTLIIAHRLSTIQHADKILVLHHGKLCEMGNHQQLLEKRGLYYDLYRLQYA